MDLEVSQRTKKNHQENQTNLKNQRIKKTNNVLENKKQQKHNYTQTQASYDAPSVKMLKIVRKKNLFSSLSV